jgi:hypothetical protein
VNNDVVSAEEAQGMLDRDRIAREVYGLHGGYDGARLARTVIALHARLDAVTAERDGLREDHRAASNACASATLRAGFFSDIVHGVVRVLDPRDGEATVDAAQRVVRELAVLRAQLPPLCAVHDALVAAAALPGAGASPEAMVAAVRAQAWAEGVEAMREAVLVEVSDDGWGDDLTDPDRDNDIQLAVRNLSVTLPLPGAEVSRG